MKTAFEVNMETEQNMKKKILTTVTRFDPYKIIFRFGTGCVSKEIILSFSERDSI